MGSGSVEVCRVLIMDVEVDSVTINTFATVDYLVHHVSWSGCGLVFWICLLFLSIPFPMGHPCGYIIYMQAEVCWRVGARFLNICF